MLFYFLKHVSYNFKQLSTLKTNHLKIYLKQRFTDKAKT